MSTENLKEGYTFVKFNKISDQIFSSRHGDIKLLSITTVPVHMHLFSRQLFFLFRFYAVHIGPIHHSDFSSVQAVHSSLQLRHNPFYSEIY